MADVSSYPKPQTPQNPVAVYGQLLQAQGLANQNKLFQQEFGDRAAMNDAYKFATDPQTGVVDMGRLAAALAGSGMGRLLPQAQQNIQEFQKRGLEIDEKNTAVAKQRLELIGSQLSGLLSRPDFTRLDAAKAAARIVAMDAIPVGMATSIISNLAEGGPELRQQITELMIGNLASQERLKATTPNVQLVDTGGAIKPTDVNPLTNRNILNGGAIQKTLSPSEAIAPTPVLIRNPDGTYSRSNVTREQFGSMAAQGPVATEPALTASGLTPAEATATVDITGPDGTKYTVTKQQFVNMTGGGGGASRPGGAPGASAMQAPAPGIPGVQTGARPGQLAAADVLGTQSAKQGIDLQSLADQVPVRKAALQNMESALQNFTSGPGADWKLFAKSLVNANVAPIFDPQKIASQEEFTKQATQVALQQLQTLGTGTDEKLGSAIKANPSTALSKLGNQQIMQLLKGNEDAIAAKNQAWQEWLTQGNGPESYGKFSTAFNKQFDPRAFQAAYMTPDERKKLVDSMSERDRATFRNNFNLAVQRGWIPDIRGQ
jgi:hypothetical protein